MIVTPATANQPPPVSPWCLAQQKLAEALHDPHDILLVKQAWTTYATEVTLRKPQPGDLHNMDLLRSRIEPLHPELHQRITALSAEWARVIAMRYYNHVVDAIEPISYSGAMEWFVSANKALDAIDVYELYSPPIQQPFSMRPFADYLQRLAALEKNLFQDFKDTEFVPEFEKLMIRISRRHIGSPA